MKKKVFILMLLVVFLLAMGMVVKADNDIKAIKDFINKDTKYQYNYYKGLSDRQLNNIAKVVKELRALNIPLDPFEANSETAKLSNVIIASLLGNMFAESGVDPEKIEGYYPESPNETESQEQAEERGTTALNTGLGLCQWTDSAPGGRRAKLLNFAKQKGKSWKDLNVQISLFYDETFTGVGWSNFYRTPNNYGKDHIYTDSSISSDKNIEVYATLTDYLSTDDVDRATVIFCRSWEVPDITIGSLTDRICFARESLEVLNNVSISGDTGYSGAGNSASSDRRGKKGIFTGKIRTDAPKSELQIAKGLREYQDFISLSEKLYTTDISLADKAESSRLGFLIAQRENSKGIGNLRIVTTLLGAFMGLWGTLGFLILMVAKFADGVLYSEVIYRKMFFAGPENGGRNVLLAKEIIRPLILVIVGILIMNGTVYEWVIQLMVLFNNLTS